MGPLLVAFVTQLTGSLRTGITSIILLFVVGGGVFLKVPEQVEVIEK